MSKRLAALTIAMLACVAPARAAETVTLRPPFDDAFADVSSNYSCRRIPGGSAPGRCGGIGAPAETPVEATADAQAGAVRLSAEQGPTAVGGGVCVFGPFRYCGFLAFVDAWAMLETRTVRARGGLLADLHLDSPASRVDLAATVDGYSYSVGAQTTATVDMSGARTTVDLGRVSGPTQVISLTVDPDEGFIPAGEHTVQIAFEASGGGHAMGFATDISVTSISLEITP